MEFSSRWKCELLWRHNERDRVSNHRRLDCLLNRLLVADQRKHQSSVSLAFMRGMDSGTSPMNGEFPAQRASNVENVPIWCRHHGMKTIWWNRSQDIKVILRQPNMKKVDLPWKGRSVSPLIDIHSSIKAIYKSVIDIMDIHNSNMNIYNSVMYIRNSITDIQPCIIEKQLWISMT